MVATDVLPLLVHACTEECISHRPKQPHGYVPKAHRGGLNVSQPPRSDIQPLSTYKGDVRICGDTLTALLLTVRANRLFPQRLLRNH